MALFIMAIFELPIDLNKAAPELYRAINGYENAEIENKFLHYT